MSRSRRRAHAEADGCTTRAGEAAPCPDSGIRRAAGRGWVATGVGTVRARLGVACCVGAAAAACLDTAAAVAAFAGCVLECMTISVVVAPVATISAEPKAITLIPSAPPSAAPLAAPPPEKLASELGSGRTTRPLNAERCARNRRANVEHSSHSRRCARSEPRSPRGSSPSSCRERARSASLHVMVPSSCSRNARRARKIERLDGALADLERRGDLLVGAALELAHRERRALWECQRGQGALDVLALVAVLVLVVADRSELGVERDLTRAPGGGAKSLAADVVRDRDQPVADLLRPCARLVRAVRVEKCRLDDVLGVSIVCEHGKRIAIDVLDVSLVQALESTVGRCQASDPHTAVYRARRPVRYPSHEGRGHPRPQRVQRITGLRLTVTVLVAFPRLAVWLAALAVRLAALAGRRGGGRGWLGRPRCGCGRGRRPYRRQACRRGADAPSTRFG